MTTIPEIRPELERVQTATDLRLAIGRTARRLRQHAGHELSPSRSTLLDTIARHGPLSPSRLAELERMSRPTITRLVAKLKAEGYVECLSDPEDGRSYQISISPKGKALRDVRRRRKSEYLTRLLESADARDLEVLGSAAQVLMRLLERDDV
jgi:DNA-binding MarR family transcriptional regulator